MILEIKTYPDPILKKKALPIKVVDEEIKKLICDMKETMVLEKGDKINGVGLAAPQIGASKRIIVILTKKGPKGFINPKILKSSREKEIGKEGCLSVPGLWLKIKRPKTIEVSAWDEESKEVKISADGFLAKVFQHEIDHLEGILFFERLPILERWRVKRKLLKNVD